MTLNSKENPNDDDLSALIARLVDTQQRLGEITGGKVDAVVVSPAGLVLLPVAQQHVVRSESEMRQIAEERGAILDAIPSALALLATDGCILFANRAWREFSSDTGLFGSRFAAGQNYYDLLASSHTEALESAKLITEGTKSVMNGDARSFSAEYSLHHQGQESWFEITVTPMPRESGYGAVITHSNITPRKHADASARENAEQIKTLIEGATVGILVRRGFKPIMANDEFARIFGFENANQILALDDCRVLYVPEDQHLVKSEEPYRSDIAARSSYSLRGLRNGGSVVQLVKRAFSINWAGQPAICAMVADVTEQRRTEAALRQSQRLEAVGQLTGGVAHDFNNLLQVIIGNTEFLEESLSDDQKLRLAAEMTRTAAERGAELTRRMLAFARRQPLNPSTLDINRLISSMEGLLRRSLGEQIEIEVVRGAGLWNAFVDEAQFESAILNIAINARDAMPAGGKLTIETANARLDDAYAEQHEEVEPGQYVMIALTDVGHGMDAPTLAHVFDPFFTTKEVGKGSGLGLSMVYGFVKQSKGHVRIYSELEMGTTVRLYIPRSQEPVAALEPRTAQSALPHGSESILVVEDHELVRDHVTGQLRSLGYTVTSVSNGIDALKALQQGEHFDLLFTDIVMPGGMNGRELADQCQKLRPTLPVLFTSGYTENAIVHQGRLDRGVSLLSKPYRKRDLAVKIRALIDAVRDTE